MSRLKPKITAAINVEDEAWNVDSEITAAKTVEAEAQNVDIEMTAAKNVYPEMTAANNVEGKA